MIPSSGGMRAGASCFRLDGGEEEDGEDLDGVMARRRPAQIFSFAEAVDGDNRALRFKDRPLNWGGATQLCTRESKFEINEQVDCGTRGLAVAGFAAVDMSSGGKTLRFAMP